MIKKLRWASILLLALVLLALPLEAFARRSGGSFSSRGGFRSPSSSPSRSPGTSYDRGGYRGGPSFFFFPGFGWGGMGGGGGFGSLLMLGMLGVGGYFVYRAVRNASRNSGGPRSYSYGGDDYDVDVRPDRAYVYKLQLGLGRSARSLQQKLAQFAEEGDTASETGLAQLASQTALELSRQKHSIRYVQVSSDGPLSMAQGETKMNTLALAERSRFEVERVRGADGRVRKAEDKPTQSDDVLEYIVVTVLVATRQALANWKPVTEHEELEGVLASLGGVSPREILGLEVVWTPADADDALTENDLLMTYPNLRAI